LICDGGVGTFHIRILL